MNGPQRGDETLEHLVAHVVIHEAGHHFGLSDDDMHALEDEAGMTGRTERLAIVRSSGTVSFMKRTFAAIAALASTIIVAPAGAQDGAEALSPNQIVNAATPDDWVGIPANDLVVMTLAPDRDGNPREVVIHLMPEPFSQGWIANIRTLARAGWYDGVSVNRVQDNYVVQWGDGDGSRKPLPDGLRLNVVPESGNIMTIFPDRHFRTCGQRSAGHTGDYRGF